MTENEAIRILGDTTLCTPLGQAAFVGIEAIKKVQQYRAIGTVEECLEARERQRGKKPLYKHYEDEGEPPYVKISCPNGCGIQLYPVTEKHLAHEHEFCPNCGQKLDWSEQVRKFGEKGLME